MYQTWLAIGWDSNEIRDKAKADVRKMKEGVKEQMNAKRLKQSEICDGVRSADGKLLSKTSPAPKTIPKTDVNGTVATNGTAARSPSDVEKGIFK